jgi:hypothetical protein
VAGHQLRLVNNKANYELQVAKDRMPTTRISTSKPSWLIRYLHQPGAFQGSQKVQHKIILFACIAILVGSLLFYIKGTELYFFGYKWPMRCFLYQTFGIKCALCGLTRSFCSLAHGDFPASIKFHYLGPAIFAFICLQVLYRIYLLTIKLGGANRILTRLNACLAVTLAIAIFVNWFIYLGGLIYDLAIR